MVYYRVSNATVSIANVENAHHSTRLLAQTTLRNTMGTRHLHEILSERVSISGSMQVSKPYLWVHLILPPLLPLQAESTTNPYPTHFTLIPKLSSILVHNVYVRLSSKTCGCSNPAFAYMSTYFPLSTHIPHTKPPELPASLVDIYLYPLLSIYLSKIYRHKAINITTQHNLFTQIYKFLVDPVINHISLYKPYIVAQWFQYITKWFHKMIISN